MLSGINHPPSASPICGIEPSGRRRAKSTSHMRWTRWGSDGGIGIPFRAARIRKWR